MTARRASTQPPRIEPLGLGRLDAGDPALLAPGGDLDSLRFDEVTLPALDLSRATVRESRFAGLAADEADLRGARLGDVEMTGVDLPVVRAARSQWQDVAISGRMGSVEAYDTHWRSVHFVGCKLSFVNLRAAELLDVAFTDCLIEELDLGGAEARRVRFGTSRVAHLDVRQAELHDFDLRGAHLESIDGLTSLRGATIDTDQLTLLAPLLAAGLGLRVEN
ncbi:pentapeptide repeat-containing protein [Nocardioides sp. YIM 152315]|uniref:pentapeptide repeat-containing protein n=1 Tax=Nocardioides sp. YIM 152315 TaxID=3031760 RepID=UPI0023DB1135|nr:pentapeptide repeat-containing protein [Nocardioides sp. YIM 152315]MDF1605372.1 pentapeptide repeat-containing protein [Nocardioides sp. YIM 152315]